MTEVHLCPYCGEDRCVPHEVYGAVVTGEVLNPGGRQLRFKETGNVWFQISDQCNFCDNKNIKAFLDQHRSQGKLFER